MSRPVWCLDIDGVINAGDPPEGGVYQRKTVLLRSWTVQVCYDPAVISRINLLAGRADIIWLTTWGHDAVHQLSPALGLRTFAVGQEPGGGASLGARPGDRLGHPWWKQEVVAGLLREGGASALVWTDDDITGGVRAQITRAWSGPALLISPDARVGLTMVELDQIEEFLRHWERLCEPLEL